MGLAWTIVGLIAGFSALGYVELAKRYRLDWKAWIRLLVAEFLLLFCIAWCAGSIAEGVPRSASMGLIMFGGLGLVTLILTWRLLIEGNAKNAPLVPTGSTTGPLADDADSQPESSTTLTAEVPDSSRREFFGQSFL